MISHKLMRQATKWGQYHHAIAGGLRVAKVHLSIITPYGIGGERLHTRYGVVVLP